MGNYQSTSRNIGFVAVTLILSACFGGGGDRSVASSAGGSDLPLKEAFSPNGDNYSSPSNGTLEPDDPGYNGGINNLPKSASTTPSELNAQKDVMRAIRADWAWGHQTNCNSVTVGIVDSGVDTSHPDLNDNLYEISSGVFGRDFEGSTASSNVTDLNGHGTHVAGIIGAVGDNGVGVTGVCWDAKILSAKVTDANGSAFLSDVVQGMEYVLDSGARVVNASLGSTVESTTADEHQQFEDIFASVTAKAESRGALIVAAAGNSGLDIDVDRTYPAALESEYIVAVASNAQPASLFFYPSSNFGGGTVHLSAPGYDITSTVRHRSQSGYDSKTGTSMAAPLVAGTFALAWSYIGISNINGLSLKNLLLNNVRTDGSSNSEPGNVLITGGRLDIGSVLEASKEYKDSL